MAGNGPPPKPWERAGSASGPSPFRPPSNGNTSDVVEASGTAKPGEPVSTINPTTTTTNTLSRPGPRPWEQNYSNSYGGSTLASGYGPGSSMLSGGYNNGYLGNSYGNNMYNSGYGGYNSNLYGGLNSFSGMNSFNRMNSYSGYNNSYSGYNRPMGYGPMGMGVGPYNNPDDPNNPFGPPSQPPGFWMSFLRVLSGFVGFFGRVAFLIDQNTQAFHLFMQALLELFDKSGMLYGELARFILRVLGIRTPPRKNIDGSGPPSIPGPKANNSGNSFGNDWGDDFAKGQ